MGYENHDRRIVIFSAIIHVRWNTDECHTITVPMYFAIQPWYLHWNLGQGDGLLKDEEVAQKSKAEIQALANILRT